MKGSTSLIMCVTPFQMMLAKRIIELNPNSQFDLITIPHLNDTKHRHYYNKLSKLCENSIFYNKRGGFTGFLKYMWDLRVHGFNKDYDNLYLSSIDSRYFQLILSRNPNATIYTFDDGTVNINPTSLYYSDAKPSVLKRSVWRLLGVKIYMKEIKNLSSLHYTVYNGASNIIESTETIILFPAESLKLNSSRSPIKIFLGQPLDELNLDISRPKLTKALDDLKIDLYYPHPREVGITVGNFGIINSDLIFEDYLVQYLNNDPQVPIEIYSICSSAVLNILTIPQVRANYIYNIALYNKFKGFYKVSEQLNVNLIEVDF